MHQGPRELAHTLRTLGAELGAWDKQDTAVLHRLHTTVQGALQTIPESMRRLHALLQLLAAGLHELPQQDGVPRQRLVEAIMVALVAGEQLLLLETQPDAVLAVDEAGRAVLKILGRDPTEWNVLTQPSTSTSSVQAALSLDDVAALFVQLEVTDRDDLARVRDALQQVANDIAAYANETRSLTAEAAKKLTLHGAAPSTSESSQPIPEATLLSAETDFALLGEFITECREYICSAEAALLSLQILKILKPPIRSFVPFTPSKALPKGTAAFLGLKLVADLAHHAESLLSRIRGRDIPCTGGRPIWPCAPWIC